MFKSEQEGFARYLELMHTHGREYNHKIDFNLSKLDKKYCTEEDIRNTQEGLDACLNEMNLLLEGFNVIHEYEGKFLGKLRRLPGLARLVFRDVRLKNKAIKAATKQNLGDSYKYRSLGEVVNVNNVIYFSRKK